MNHPNKLSNYSVFKFQCMYDDDGDDDDDDDNDDDAGFINDK